MSKKAKKPTSKRSSTPAKALAKSLSYPAQLKKCRQLIAWKDGTR